MKLADLKPGDIACVLPTREEPRIVTVERITKTQVVTTGGGRFNKATGHLIGRGRWDSTSLEPATPALVSRARIATVRSKIKTALFRASDEMQAREPRIEQVQQWAQIAANFAEEWQTLTKGTSHDR